MNANDPAYPVLAGSLADLPMSSCSGLTIRQEFAKAAMQAILSNDTYTTGLVTTSSKDKEVFEKVARSAAEIADALIAELNKQPE